MLMAIQRRSGTENFGRVEGAKQVLICFDHFSEVGWVVDVTCMEELLGYCWLYPVQIIKFAVPAWAVSDNKNIGDINYLLVFEDVRETMVRK